MSFRQTKLSLQNFFNAPKQGDAAVTESEQQRLAQSSISSTETLAVEGDTIVVGGGSKSAMLPTPSETASDDSKQLGRVSSIRRAPSWGNQRVPQKAQEHPSQDHVESKSRSVSGQTLVTSDSESSLLRESIAALNIPWSVTSLPDEAQKQTAGVLPKDQLPTPDTEEDDAEEAERKARADMKKAKMEENARIRALKQKEADDKATRRSSRASLLTRAGDTMSDLTATVLGKRPHELVERTAATLKRARPQSMIMASDVPSFEGPTSKKRRMSNHDVLVEEVTTTPPKKVSKLARDKKWLRGGLYTGQSRAFNGAYTESKNKKKAATEPDQVREKENASLPLPMFAGERLLKQGRDFKLPFDIFSPLTDRQPKPDEWRKTNKNVFIGDAADYWRSNVYPQEHSTCMCTLEAGCQNDNCLNRIMNYECDEKNCKLTEEQCGNRAFEGLKHRSKKHNKYDVGVEVIKTADRGYGVRSNRCFEPNQIIVEYTGEIITQEECDSRMHNLYKDNEVRAFCS